jgi:hypothetical protein
VIFNTDSVMIEPPNGGGGDPGAGSSSSDVMDGLEDEEREGWDNKTQASV